MWTCCSCMLTRCAWMVQNFPFDSFWGLFFSSRYSFDTVWQTINYDKTIWDIWEQTVFFLILHLNFVTSCWCYRYRKYNESKRISLKTVKMFGESKVSFVFYKFISINVVSIVYYKVWSFWKLWETAITCALLETLVSVRNELSCFLHAEIKLATLYTICGDQSLLDCKYNYCI